MERLSKSEASSSACPIGLALLGQPSGHCDIELCVIHRQCQSILLSELHHLLLCFPFQVGAVSEPATVNDKTDNVRPHQLLDKFSSCPEVKVRRCITVV